MVDAMIASLIRPPVPCCTGQDDPLGLDGKPAWLLTHKLIPRGHAERDALVRASLQPKAEPATR